jgi:hypothetical protein
VTHSYKNLASVDAVRDLFSNLRATQIDTAVAMLNATADHTAAPNWADALDDDFIAPLADGGIVAWGAEHAFGRNCYGEPILRRDLVAYSAPDVCEMILSAAEIDARIDEEREGEIDGLMAARHDAIGDTWDHDYASDSRGFDF